MTSRLDNAENFLAALTPGGIESQEAEGQRTFVASETLPREAPWKELEKLGFKFLKEGGDDIFAAVVFPEGWKKEPTDHSMWSELLDPKGRIRGSIFYKASFYDRSAFMRLARYYNYTQVHEHHDGYIKDHVQYFVNNADGNVVYKTTPIKAVKHSKEAWAAGTDAEKEASEWLKENYPEWENTAEYWD